MATSIVDYLKAQGQDSSVSARAKLAVDQGFASSEAEYLNLASTGRNADINTKLLGALEAGTAPSVEERPPTPVSSFSSINNGPISGAEIERGSGLPEPGTFIETQTGPSFSDQVGAIAKTTFSSNQLEIDNLRAELGRLNESSLTRAKAEQERLTGKVEEFVDSTAAQDALRESDRKFKVEENIALYADVQTKVVAAQEALEMGLIYEKDRPARMKFITGAESTLMKQGLATIGALQGTAAVIKGNLDLARSFGDATVAAINADNDRSFKALTTLIDLNTNDLIDLTQRERDIIDQRLDSIEDEATRLQENKEEVLDYMTDFPKAFLAGGVTLMDTKEQALKKMLPHMAADEKALFDAKLAGSATQVSEQEEAEFKGQLLSAKNNGMPFEDAVLAFGDVLPYSYIEDIYGEGGPAIDPVKAVTGAYYEQFLTPEGGVKEGFQVSIDPKNGRPIITKKEEDGGGDNIFQKVGGFFKSFF